MIWAGLQLAASIIALGCFCLWWGYRAGKAEGASHFYEVNDISWCPVHYGVFNEDSYDCDFKDDDEECQRHTLYRIS